MNRLPTTALLLGALLLPVACGAATDVLVGWVHSDLGLDQEGDGFILGVAGTWLLGDGPFDIAAGGEYLRKRGVQPMLVASPEQGLVRSDAEVTLSCLQPTLAVGWNLPLGALRLRPYAGCAVSIKLDESWDRVAGPTGRDYGYEDVDVVVDLGLQLHYRDKVFLDARFSQGLLGQVVERDGDGFTKELDPLTGATLPEDGDTVSWYQVGVGVSF